MRGKLGVLVGIVLVGIGLVSACGRQSPSGGALSVSELLQDPVYDTVVTIYSKYEHDPEHPAQALRVLLDECAADPACAAAFPELDQRLYTLVGRLNADPVVY